jgi:hypothetical protein
MIASFLLSTASLSENPRLVQNFPTVVRKSWLLPEGIWHIRILKKSISGALIPYEALNFRDQSTMADPKKLLSWQTLCRKTPLAILTVPSPDGSLILRIDGPEKERADAFLAEIHQLRAQKLRELHLPFVTPTDLDEKKKFDWLKNEGAISEEEHREMTAALSL